MKKRICLNAVLLLLGASGFSEDTLSLRLVNGQSEVRFQPLSNWQYTVEFSTNLTTWIPLEEGLFGTGDIICTNQSAGQQRCFYRTKRSDNFTVSFNPACFKLGSESSFFVTENVGGNLTNYTEVVRVEGILPKNGYSSVEINTYINGTEWSETEYILQDISKGLFLVATSDSVDGEVFFDPPEPLGFNQFIPGIQGVPVEFPAPQAGFGPLTSRVTASIEYGAITVPAGTFKNTIKVQEVVTGIYFEMGPDISHTMLTTTWYAKEVGEVKCVFSWDFEVLGNYVTRSKELASYSLK